MADNINNTWYVSFETRRNREAAWKEQYQNKRVTFLNEIDAKEFARTKFAEGLNVSAGTINPHFPKRTIASTQFMNGLEQNARSKGEQRRKPNFASIHLSHR